MRRVDLRLLAAACLVFGFWAVSAVAGSFDAAVASIDAQGLGRHAAVLASDTFEGREAGTRGGRAAGAYLISELAKLGLQPAGSGGAYDQPFGAEYRNVLALLPGQDPVLRDEYVVIGAHYDHVGYGAQNSYGPVGRIHNGADDNASGTAGLLALAEAFASLEVPPRRTVVFAFWDAEEIGLLGSRHWTAHPTVPLEQVRLKVNLDMIGRLRNDTVEVSGWRTAPGLRRLASLQNRETGLRFVFDPGLTDDSDHFPFLEKGIPFLMLHTFKHEDYHRPGDEFDKLNLEGMQQICRLVFRIVHAAAQSPALPPFRAEVRGEAADFVKRLEEPLPPLPTRLGISWSAERAADGIIEVTAVSAGSPAERDGFRAGDRILEFDGRPVAGSADLHERILGAPASVRVVIRRPGVDTPLERSVTLRGEPMTLGINWRSDPADPGGAVLTRVVPGSAAARAGLQPRDRIYAVNGRTFESGDEFRRLVHAPRGPLTVTVERAGRVRDVELPVRSQGGER